MRTAPRRRVTCTLELQADSMEDLIAALEDIARRIGMDDLARSGFSAGYNSAYNYRMDEDENITHDSWRAALEEWRKRRLEPV